MDNNLAIVPRPIRSCTFNKCQCLWHTYLDQVFDIDASFCRTSFEVPECLRSQPNCAIFDAKSIVVLGFGVTENQDTISEAIERHDNVLSFEATSNYKTTGLIMALCFSTRVLPLFVIDG